VGAGYRERDGLTWTGIVAGAWQVVRAMDSSVSSNDFVEISGTGMATPDQAVAI
jgi:hypothetical protein